MSSGQEQVESYGLQDPKVLEVAVELAPALFAALDISNKLPESSYPLTAGPELERAFREIATDEDLYESPGVSITKDDVTKQFPSELLPIVDRTDLLRKVYMVIIIARNTAANKAIDAAKRGKLRIEASHPFDVGDL